MKRLVGQRDGGPLVRRHPVNFRMRLGRVTPAQTTDIGSPRIRPDAQDVEKIVHGWSVR